MLTAFVDAARRADSYTGALRAVLASVCDELKVESAALLGRHDGSPVDYRCLVAAGVLDAAAPVVAADGFLITRLRAYPLPLPFAPNELDALADWAAAHRPERLDEIRALAAAGIRLAVPLRTRSEILGVLLLGERPHRSGFSAHEKQVLRASARSVRADDRKRAADRSVRRTRDAPPRHRPGLGRPAPPAARCASAGRWRRFRRGQRAGSPHRRRLLRFRRAARPRDRHCAGGRVGQRRRRRLDHVGGAGVAADHLVRGRRAAATSRRADE